MSPSTSNHRDQSSGLANKNWFMKMQSSKHMYLFILQHLMLYSCLDIPEQNYYKLHTELYTLDTLRYALGSSVWLHMLKQILNSNCNIFVRIIVPVILHILHSSVCLFNTLYLQSLASNVNSKETSLILIV